MAGVNYHFDLSGDPDCDLDPPVTSRVTQSGQNDDGEDIDSDNGRVSDGDEASDNDTEISEVDLNFYDELIFDSDGGNGDGDGERGRRGDSESSLYPASEYSETRSESVEGEENREEDTESGESGEEEQATGGRKEEEEEREEQVEEWEVVPPCLLDPSSSSPSSPSSFSPASSSSSSSSSSSRSRYFFQPQNFARWISYRDPPEDGGPHDDPRLPPGQFARDMFFSRVPLPYPVDTPLRPVYPGFRPRTLWGDTFTTTNTPPSGVDALLMEFRGQGLDIPFPTQQENQPNLQQATHLSRGRRSRPRMPRCKFCVQNGEEEIWHIFKDEDGKVICPILSQYTCKLCGATGPDAHTLKYCPKNRLTRGDPVAAGMSPGLMPLNITIDDLRDDFSNM